MHEHGEEECRFTHTHTHKVVVWEMCVDLYWWASFYSCSYLHPSWPLSVKGDERSTITRVNEWSDFVVAIYNCYWFENVYNCCSHYYNRPYLLRPESVKKGDLNVFLFIAHTCSAENDLYKTISRFGNDFIPISYLEMLYDKYTERS